MGGYQGIQRADRRALRFELYAQWPINGSRYCIEGRHLEGCEEEFQLGMIQVPALARGDAEAQLGQGDRGQNDFAVGAAVQALEDSFVAGSLV